MYWACCVCVSFYTPLWATSHSIGVDFLATWPNRVNQTTKDVTWNYMPASCATITCLRQFLQAVGGQIEFDWGRFWLHVIIQIHTYVTESGGPESYAAYCNRIVFLPAFGGQISFYRGRFSIEWASYCRIFQPSEDVTENMIFAVYILHLYQFLVVFSGQISFDGGDCPGNWFHGKY